MRLSKGYLTHKLGDRDRIWFEIEPALDQLTRWRVHSKRYIAFARKSPGVFVLRSAVNGAGEKVAI